MKDKPVLALPLYQKIVEILEDARKTAYRSINRTMVHAYWRIGQQIVEHEQAGELRAEYGKAVLKELSRILTAQFGKGFDSSNLRNMRLFYLRFRYVTQCVTNHRMSAPFARSQTGAWERVSSK